MDEAKLKELDAALREAVAVLPDNQAAILSELLLGAIGAIEAEHAAERDQLKTEVAELRGLLRRTDMFAARLEPELRADIKRALATHVEPREGKLAPEVCVCPFPRDTCPEECGVECPACFDACLPAVPKVPEGGG